MANALITRVTFYSKIKEGSYMNHLYDENHRMWEEARSKSWWHFNKHEAIEGSSISMVWRSIKGAIDTLEFNRDINKSDESSNKLSDVAESVGIDLTPIFDGWVKAGHSAGNGYITYISQIFPSSVGDDMLEFFVDILSWNNPWPGVVFCKMLADKHKLTDNGQGYVGFRVNDEGFVMCTGFDEMRMAEPYYSYYYYSDDPAKIAHDLDKCFLFDDNGPFAYCLRPDLIDVGRLKNPGCAYAETSKVSNVGTESCMKWNIEQLSTINVDAETQIWDSYEDITRNWIDIATNEKGYSIEPFNIGGPINFYTGGMM